VSVIARLTRYRTPPAALPWLINEIVTLARARSDWVVRDRDRAAEFFFVDTPSGDGLSVVVGEGLSVMPAIDVEGAERGEAEECEVQLLQVGGPRDSGVVPALSARVVRCAPDALHDGFNGDAVPTSTHVWVRALLRAASGDVLAFAVGTDRIALEDSLRKLTGQANEVNDFDDCVYHFWRDRS
jgi:hypothetical protein